MDDKRLLKTLNILKPYLGKLVIVGGWVPYLYHKYLLKNKPDSLPLGTMDLDLASRPKIPVIDGMLIENLLEEAGYKCEIYQGYQNPPITKYICNDDETEIEFLTYKIGKDFRNTHLIQSGLSAQKLRYVDVLLANTIDIFIKDKIESKKYIELLIKVPNPARFIFQKVLVFNDSMRKRDKRNKDLFYVYDIIANYTELYVEIITEMSVLKSEYKKWFIRFVRILEEAFDSELADGPSILDSQRQSGYPSRSIFLTQSTEKMKSFISDVKKCCS